VEAAVVVLNDDVEPIVCVDGVLTGATETVIAIDGLLDVLDDDDDEEADDVERTFALVLLPLLLLLPVVGIDERSNQWPKERKCSTSTSNNPASRMVSFNSGFRRTYSLILNKINCTDTGVGTRPACGRTVAACFNCDTPCSVFRRRNADSSCSIFFTSRSVRIRNNMINA
jgi:hypothetical protein